MDLAVLYRYGVPLAIMAVLTGGLVMVRTPVLASTAETAEYGIGYLLKGDLVRARDVLKRVSAEDPENFRALYGLGLVEFRAGHYDRAETSLKAALKLKEDAEAMLTLGAVYQEQKSFDLAEEAYLSVRRLAPDHPKVAYNLGMLYVATRRLRDAKQEYTLFLKLAPQAPERFKIMARLRLIDTHLKDRKKS